MPDMTYHAQETSSKLYMGTPKFLKTDKALHDQFGNQYVNFSG